MAPTPDSLPPTRAPVQERSRRTLRRIVGAALAMLQTQSFQELRISELLKRSRTSAGVFYARFENKEAFLEYLDEVCTYELVERVEQFTTDPAHDRKAARALVRDLLQFLVDLYVERRGIFRALILQARQHPSPTFDSRLQTANGLVSSLTDFLASRLGEACSADRVNRAFLMVLCLLRERILFPEGPAALWPGKDRELVKELTTSFLTLTDLGGRS